MRPAAAAVLILAIWACGLATTDAKNTTAPPSTALRSEGSQAPAGAKNTTAPPSTALRSEGSQAPAEKLAKNKNTTAPPPRKTTAPPPRKTSSTSSSTKGNTTTGAVTGTPDLAGLAGEWHGVSSTKSDRSNITLKDCVIFSVQAKGKSLWTDWSKTGLFNHEYTCDYKRIGGPTSVAGFQKLLPLSVACTAGGWWRLALNYAEAYVVSPYGVTDIRATTLVSCAFMRRAGSMLQWAEARWSIVTDCARYAAPTSKDFDRRGTFTLALNGSSSTAKKPFTTQPSLCQSWIPKKKTG